MVKVPFEPKWSRKWIENRLSKNYYKKPYDRFMWWRGYTPKNKPLTNRHPLRDRIANGDFDTRTLFNGNRISIPYYE